MNKARRVQIEGTLLALAFLDLLGFGMLIPDVQIRLDDMIAPFSFGWIEMKGVCIGMVLSSMFLVQFVVSGYWGKWSDKIGRKPVVVLCTFISASAMAVYAIAHNPWLILLSRIIAGLGAANIAVAQAYVADLAATGTKLAAMGRISAAISAGLIAGPAIGGRLAHQGGNQLLGWTAASCSVAGAFAALILLPRIAPAPRQEKPKGHLDLLRTIPGLGRVFVVIAVGWLALATLEGTFGRLIKDNLGMGQLEFGYIFAYESVLALLVPAFLLVRIEKLVSTTVALRSAYVAMGVGLVLFPFAPALWALFVASTFYAVGAAVASPTANALCSKLTPEERQGEMFGLMQSARSFGFLVGPVVGGWLFDLWHASPYVLAMAVCLAAAFAVPRVSNQTVEATPA